MPANAIAAIRVELGTQIGDPLARLAAVKESIKTVRDDRASLPEEAVTPYVLLRAAPLFASQLPAVGRFVPTAIQPENLEYAGHAIRRSISMAPGSTRSTRSASCCSTLP